MEHEIYQEILDRLLADLEVEQNIIKFKSDQLSTKTQYCMTLKEEQIRPTLEKLQNLQAKLSVLLELTRTNTASILDEVYAKAIFTLQKEIKWTEQKLAELVKEYTDIKVASDKLTTDTELITSKIELIERQIKQIKLKLN